MSPPAPSDSPTEPRGPAPARPLTGITVLDFGQIYNGPYCGYLLAMAGARVIKIEPPGGEGMRGQSDGLASYAFMMFNGNKQMATLNLKTERGRQLLRALAAEADVVLENFSPGTMARLGVGSAELRKVNPGLIYAAGTGFGGAGPHRDYLAMDLTVQAMTGIMAITGDEGERPMKAGAALCDILGGVHLYAAITTALVQRERRGVGAVLDVAMQDAVLPTLATALGAYYRMGGEPPRTGNRHRALAVAPYNVYAAKDGFVAIICINERHWRSLAEAMGRPDLVEDPRFADMRSRAAHMEATDAEVEAWTSTLPKADVFAVCQRHEVVCAPVQSLGEVLHDPHLLERGALAKLAHAHWDEVILPGTPLRFEQAAPPPVELPRAAGADNALVYGDLLGLPPAELATLAADGVI